VKKTELYKGVLEKLKREEICRIAFIGNSITSGEWVMPNYRAMVEYILKYALAEEFDDEKWWIPEWNMKFYNYSLDGGTTKEFLKSYELAVEECSPDLFFVLGTSNDMELNLPVEGFVENTLDLFERITKAGKKCVYSPDPFSDDSENNRKYEKYLTELNKNEFPDGLVNIDGYEISKGFPRERIYTLEMSESEQKMFGRRTDPIHPNILGYVYITKLFLEGAFGIKVDAEKFFKEITSNPQ